MVKSGLYYSFGIGFWGPNGHDGVWHISLIQSMLNAVSSGNLSNLQNMPIFAGESLKNYHIGFDLLVALVSGLTGVSPLNLYFQVIPVLLSITIGFLVYLLVFRIVKSSSAALWSTFFVYFGGNLGWVVTLFRTGELGGESMFWAQQAISTLLNPPFALSLVVLLLAIGAWQNRRFVLSVILFGILIQVKAYAGVLALPALALVGMYELVKHKQSFTLKTVIVASMVSFALFVPLNSGSGGLIELRPFWFLETMMAFPDRVGWSRFGEAMVNYKLAGNAFKGVAAYLFALVIFWYGNVGTRAIFELLFLKRKNKDKFGEAQIFMVFMILGGLLASMLFVQKGTAWNTIQFMYYSLFFSSILAGISVDRITRGRRGYYAGMVIFLFTIPTTFAILRHYLPNRPPAKISYEELSALQYLSSLPKGTVLVMPFNREQADSEANNPPRPLYFYESTSYVSAFSGQQVWLEDEVNLDILGYDWQSRKDKLLALLKSDNKLNWDSFLLGENIKYIYAVKALKPPSVLNGYDKTFENNEAEIYTVRKLSIFSTVLLQ